MSRILGVVPARMGASRFPGKPLARLCGRPMLEHVYRRASACALLDEVIIATCDDAIAEAANGFGARVVMTAPDHARACDRVAEAAATDPAGIVVVIQGDEPMIRPEMIVAAVEPLLRNPEVVCTNLVSEITSEAELLDNNTIKVAMAADGRALYFSRQPVPTWRGPGLEPATWFKQVCVIPLRHQTLRAFSSLSPGRLERVESVDMLRFLEHGIPVHMVATRVRTHAVDTPEDLRLVERLMAGQETGAQ
jgi:3-deoxy-manno-octulosonate cytidylyltransferase (CMP-KDO synthetase)